MVLKQMHLSLYAQGGCYVTNLFEMLRTSLFLRRALLTKEKFRNIKFV
jgi:hypothetical protein